MKVSLPFFAMVTACASSFGASAGVTCQATDLPLADQLLDRSRVSGTSWFAHSGYQGLAMTTGVSSRGVGRLAKSSRARATVMALLKVHSAGTPPSMGCGSVKVTW